MSPLKPSGQAWSHRVPAALRVPMPSRLFRLVLAPCARMVGDPSSRCATGGTRSGRSGRTRQLGKGAAHGTVPAVATARPATTAWTRMGRRIQSACTAATRCLTLSVPWLLDYGVKWL